MSATQPADPPAADTPDPAAADGNPPDEAPDDGTATDHDDDGAHGSYRLPSEGDQPAAGDIERRLAVLLYSDDLQTRRQVRMAVGRRAAPGLPEIAWTECATQTAVLDAVDRGGLDVLILDGEASPAGGMGLCKQLKDEIYRCPPVLVLTGRPQDAWLATWSRADHAVPHPLDPVQVADAVATLARRRVAS